jgi:hypothetical protein
MGNGHDTFGFSPLIFTQFVSFRLSFSARTHTLPGFMPLLLYPIWQFLSSCPLRHWNISSLQVSTCHVIFTGHHTFV